MFAIKLCVLCTIVYAILCICGAQKVSNDEKEEGHDFRSFFCQEDENFINSMHDLTQGLTDNVVVPDNQVVWSPFAVGTVLALINNDTEMIDRLEMGTNKLVEVKNS